MGFSGRPVHPTCQIHVHLWPASFNVHDRLSVFIVCLIMAVFSFHCLQTNTCVNLTFRAFGYSIVIVDGMHVNSQIFREPPKQAANAATAAATAATALACNSKPQPQLATENHSSSHNSTLQVIGVANPEEILPNVRGIANRLYEGGRVGSVLPLEHKLWQKHRDQHPGVPHSALFANIPWLTTVDGAGCQEMQSLLRLDRQDTIATNDLAPHMAVWEEAKGRKPPPSLPSQRVSLMSTFGLLPEDPMDARPPAKS